MMLLSSGGGKCPARIFTCKEGKIMAAHDGDKERVAEILGISTRSLYRKLEASEDQP
ncbi:MAG: hypothetical protein CMP84_13005 [Gammaproteobacteria bacterium]|nr:hypothetical protein [Gammaproteobacteria bacterium]